MANDVCHKNYFLIFVFQQKNSQINSKGEYIFI